MLGHKVLRPLARRRRSVFLPLVDDMRVRKPETRAALRRVPSLVHPIDFLLLAMTTKAPRRVGEATTAAVRGAGAATAKPVVLF